MTTKNINQLKLNALTQPTYQNLRISRNAVKQQLTYNGQSPKLKGKSPNCSQSYIPSQLSQIGSPPKEKLSSLINISSSERIAYSFKIPTLRIKSKCFLKKHSTTRLGMSSYEINLQTNLQSIFVFKGSIQDMSQFKVIQMQRSELQAKQQDIYLTRQNLLLKMQMGLNVPKFYNQLSLGNYEIIQFTEEIPQNCNTLILSNTVNKDFWTVILNYHNLQFTQDKFVKLLTIVSNINDINDLQKFILDKDIFYTYMEIKEIVPDETLLTMKRNSEAMKEYYKSIHVYDHQKQKLIEEPAHQLYSERNIVQPEIEKETVRDFTIATTYPKPSEFQQILEKEGYYNPSQKRTSSRYLKLPNFKTQYSEILKQQSIKQKNQNQYTNIPDHIARKLPHMTNYNIPQLMQETGFDRQEIYEVYSRYKALLSYECSQIPGLTKQMIPNGISREAFNAGLEELSMAPPGVVDQIFKFFAKQNTLTFEGFLKAINLIKAKRNDNKIELILKLIDENENGSLSYDEIKKRCIFMMEEMLKDSKGELSVPNMVEYVTRSIFDAVKMNYDQEIPIEMIRKLIESKTHEAQVLIMMCCGDVDYLK
ncbi:unnamed protein product (macronuclear) [Paramecium tetraurelia]|uniref:EF-hand domain-containing protein n=1 Tax=Paramecium tetraurelia TaxID=5888 RepID=A0CQH8_PARTE|nr:uncharacterized protein GSPATT00009393001 [Paramecium tetraurelia]CAK73045.1 unnamed protein product [Paramecium tetraurelia]|eukprot:XP_001440442.1 hypothetical protein (macronuclear) [Paramecium tetraurelia strain d4-2]